MIRFGAWSTTLGLAAAFGLGVAALLLATARGRAANRLLAALLAAASLKLAPYVWGFAGFYEAFPWLSFAPTNLSLGFGPLLFLYVRALTTGLPTHWRRHFLPLAADLAYNFWAFSLPLARKTAWNDEVHVHWILPLETWAALLSLSTYLVLAVRALRPAGSAPADRRRRRWLLTILSALGVWLAVTAAFAMADTVGGLSYYQRFPQYLAFSLIVLTLGLEGWRNVDASAPAPAPRMRDWRADGERWADTISTMGWWREAELTLPEAARRLGTNDGYLSRALNEGLGINFATLINTYRVKEVQRRLGASNAGELLPIAFDAGFASKPSFNRAFREITGVSPSEWRRRERSG